LFSRVWNFIHIAQYGWVPGTDKSVIYSGVTILRTNLKFWINV